MTNTISVSASGVCGAYYAFPGGPHFKWGGLPMYWPATTHTHHPYHPPFPHMDHSWALRPCVAPLHRSGSPHHNWLWTVESDLAPLNSGLATTYHRVQNCQAWSTLVGMAMSSIGQATQ